MDRDDALLKGSDDVPEEVKAPMACVRGFTMVVAVLESKRETAFGAAMCVVLQRQDNPGLARHDLGPSAHADCEARTVTTWALPWSKGEVPWTGWSFSPLAGLQEGETRHSWIL